MRIDVHAHFWTDDYLDSIAALGRTDTAAQRRVGAGDGADPEARLALMDRAGVDLQVLSAAPQLPHGADARAALDAARFVNDQYADVAARHPGRFAAFASLPLPHVDASLAELARALDELGMVGVAMTTTILDQPLVDSPAAELFAVLDPRWWSEQPGLITGATRQLPRRCASRTASASPIRASVPSGGGGRAARRMRRR